MALPGETEAGSAGKQPCRGIARRAHRDDDHGRGSPLSRSSPNPIGSIDPDALKIPARRAASTLTPSARSPVPAEPAQRVYATELDPERLDEIRETVQDAGLAHVTILEAGKAETNLPAECCDAIFMSKVYHHFTNPEAINRSLYDSLKAGGALAVIDFEPDLWNFWLPHPEGVPEDRGGHGAPRSLVAKELEAAGFEIEE